MKKYVLHDSPSDGAHIAKDELHSNYMSIDS